MRELQFAKAAISTGWTLLLEQLGLEHGDVQQVLLAGSFGSYLSPASAIRIGLVPKLPVLRIVSAGNVAGEGAKMALLSLRERAGAATLLEEVEYVELSDRPEFNDRFVDQLAFPERTALIACGAIAQPAARIVEQRGWPVDVHPLPPLLHNQPQLIAGEVSRLAEELRASYDSVVVGYADCGTYGALDEVCERLGPAPAGGAALLRRVRRRQPDRVLLRRPARHLPAHRLPGEVVRPHRRDRARAGPVPRAARRVLPPLHPRRLARPGRDPRAPGRSPRTPPPGSASR